MSHTVIEIQTMHAIQSMAQSLEKLAGLRASRREKKLVAALRRWLDAEQAGLAYVDAMLDAKKLLEELEKDKP